MIRPRPLILLAGHPRSVGGRDRPPGLGLAAPPLRLSADVEALVRLIAAAATDER